ncbi:MAG: hypothetical protein OWU33_02310 [Firmicutes bacterium]|nr:hypothetical protein [Bacillota bacterium]
MAVLVLEKRQKPLMSRSERLARLLLEQGRASAARCPAVAGSVCRMQWNRCRWQIHKEHGVDIACVGLVEAIVCWPQQALGIRATDHSSYQPRRLHQDGFLGPYLTRRKRACGFQTGPLATAGTYRSCLAIRASGRVNMETRGLIHSILYLAEKCVQRLDSRGYWWHYSAQKGESGVPPRPEGRGFGAARGS